MKLVTNYKIENKVGDEDQITNRMEEEN